jgi:hypothetical protein
MALNTQVSNGSRSDAVNAITATLNTGYIRIYDGSQPANANTAVSGQTLLAELRFNATAFGAASNGVATANAVTGDASANATGTATWFRALKSDGTSVVYDGTCGTSSANMIMNTTSVTSGLAVDITALTFTAKASET